MLGLAYLIAQRMQMT